MSTVVCPIHDRTDVPGLASRMSIDPGVLWALGHEHALGAPVERAAEVRERTARSAKRSRLDGAPPPPRAAPCRRRSGCRRSPRGPGGCFARGRPRGSRPRPRRARARVAFRSCAWAFPLLAVAKTVRRAGDERRRRRARRRSARSRRTDRRSSSRSCASRAPPRPVAVPLGPGGVEVLVLLGRAATPDSAARSRPARAGSRRAGTRARGRPRSIRARPSRAAARCGGPPAPRRSTGAAAATP